MKIIVKLNHCFGFSVGSHGMLKYIMLWNNITTLQYHSCCWSSNWSGVVWIYYIICNLSFICREELVPVWIHVTLWEDRWLIAPVVRILLSQLSHIYLSIYSDVMFQQEQNLGPLCSRKTAGSAKVLQPITLIRKDAKFMRDGQPAFLHSTIPVWCDNTVEPDISSPPYRLPTSNGTPLGHSPKCHFLYQ